MNKKKSIVPLLIPGMSGPIASAMFEVRAYHLLGFARTHHSWTPWNPWNPMHHGLLDPGWYFLSGNPRLRGYQMQHNTGRVSMSHEGSGNW